MKPKKTVYYRDALNDDFAGTNINSRPLPEAFKYVHKDLFSRVFSWFIYWLFAIPLLWIPVRLIYGVRVRGRKNLRLARHKGVFFYCNHTQIVDAMMTQLYVAGFRRTYVVADQDATSIKGIRYLVQSLGCIPVPKTPSEHQKYVECLKYRIAQHRGISVFPEAHIWPYSTHIRPFGDDAFVYPAELGAAVVPMCVTYRKRRILKFAKPAITIHVGKPVFPDPSLSLPERKKALRDRVYDFMVDMACENENVEYIAYVKKTDDE